MTTQNRRVSELQLLPLEVVLALLLPLVLAVHGAADPRHRAPRRGHAPGQLRPARCTRWLVATSHYPRLPPILAALVANLPQQPKKDLRTNNSGLAPRAALGANPGSSSMCGKWGD